MRRLLFFLFFCFFVFFFLFLLWLASPPLRPVNARTGELIIRSKIGSIQTGNEGKEGIAMYKYV